MMLAVRNTITCVRRSDLECNAEVLFCEIRPDSKRKLLVAVFYRPPDSSLEYMKELKKSLRLAGKANFDQLILCGDFNLPNINWETGIAMNNDAIYNCFTKLVRDNYLWQLVDFPTRNVNVLDLVLTNVPEKVKEIYGFDDIINTDHKLISFTLDFNIPKKPVAKRIIFDYKRANWIGLNEALVHAPWDLAFVPGDVDASLANWCDLFLAAIKDHVPVRQVSGTSAHPWIDSELMSMLRRKEKQRKKARITRKHVDVMRYHQLRRETKKLIKQKRKDSALKLGDMVVCNPKRFWSLVKSSTTERSGPNVLRDGQKIVTDPVSRANLMNSFFHSVFSPKSSKSTVSSPSCPEDHLLSEIELSVAEVEAILNNLDPNKACGPDNIPGRLLKSTAAAISPSLCRLLNMSLSLGVVPENWKKANVTPVHKSNDPSLPPNYRPISLLCILSKVLERCVFNHCFPHISQFLYHLQHGFRPGRSTETQLLAVYHDLLDTAASGKEIDVIYLDLSKAFDKVPHHLLLAKLSR